MKSTLVDERGICQIVDESVKAHSQRIAIVFRDIKVTYSEFGSQTNRIAQFLSKIFHNSEIARRPIFIPIILPRSADLPMVIHGILKAGAAYVPLDENLPESRLRRILDELSPPIVLTTSSTVEKYSLLAEYNCHAIDHDDFRTSVAACGEAALECDFAPDDIAYMIYTSGSTGTPKGVMVHHQGAVNRILWMQKHYQFDQHHTILFKTPYTFDVSVWELILPFFCGAKMIVAEPMGHLSMGYLNNTVADQGVTDIHFVPSVFRVFVPATSADKLRTLKNVFCSGEALDTQTVRDFMTIAPNCEVHNLYGPTEASIDVSYWQCSESDGEHYVTTPIGQAIDNIELHILSSDMQHVADRQEGELHISGVGVAKGYFNRAELTAERFIPNPFSRDPLHATLYKTGDRARWLPDRLNIEYLGRLDFQVKINGQRVELGEIEFELCQVLEISHAVVLFNRETSILTAYLVANNSVPIESLKRQLQQSLPRYMIPQHFVFVHAIPLTSSGKVDRTALAQL